MTSAILVEELKHTDIWASYTVPSLYRNVGLSTMPH